MKSFYAFITETLYYNTTHKKPSALIVHSHEDDELNEAIYGDKSNLTFDNDMGRWKSKDEDSSKFNLDQRLKLKYSNNPHTTKGSITSESKDTYPLRDYATDSTTLNKHLFDVHNGKPSKIENHDDNEYFKSKKTMHNLNKLDEAINRTPLPEDTHIYSGIRFHPEKVASSHPDRIVHLPAYTSTSIHQSIAEEFARPQGIHKNEDGTKSKILHTLKINAPKGTKGVYMNGISKHYGEYEFLLPRKTNLKIHPKPEISEPKNDPTHGSVRHYAWNADIIKGE